MRITPDLLAIISEKQTEIKAIIGIIQLIKTKDVVVTKCPKDEKLEREDVLICGLNSKSPELPSLWALFP